VYKILVAALQRLGFADFWGVRVGLFAYNEGPTIAVAKDCWFRARQHLTRPFLWCCVFSIQSLEAFR
jgi:hypothetical protein